MEDENLEIRSQGIINLAGNLSSLNKQLNTLIDDTGKLMKNLGKNWEGDAYNSSNDYFQAFVREYPDKYDKVIKEYIQILNEKVPESYRKAETKSEDLGDAYRF